MGIAFSSVCLVHCVIVAFLPLLFPFLKHLTHATWVHIVFTSVILFTSPLAFIPGYRKHGTNWILALALMGLMFLFMGILLEEKVLDQVSHGISILGSLCLITAHAKNIQHSHAKQQCCP